MPKATKIPFGVQKYKLSARGANEKTDFMRISYCFQGTLFYLNAVFGKFNRK